LRLLRLVGSDRKEGDCFVALPLAKTKEKGLAKRKEKGLGKTKEMSMVRMVGRSTWSGTGNG